MKTVALIGAGSIGSRHLQALAALGPEWSITVVEPSSKSMAVAQSRYEDVTQDGSPKPSYHHSLDGLTDFIDVCILATPAGGRLQLVRDVLLRSKCRYMVLEKVVFQSVSDFAVAQDLFSDHGVDVWVNCPRRQWPVFQDLKTALHGSERIDGHFSRSNFALACNAVHLIDAFQFITGVADITVDASGLSDPILDDKRAGYVEFTGTLKVTNSRSDMLTLCGYASECAVPPVMTVMSDKHRWLFKQQAGLVSVAEPSSTWDWQECSVTVPPQSSLTADIVHNLITDGSCALTTFAESTQAHVPMLNAFLDRIEVASGTRPERCNIT